MFFTSSNIANTNGPSAVAVTPGNASCGASNGTITIGSVTGGTSPYTYSFDGSGYTSTLVYNNLGAGSHSISVKDANGCTFSTTANITNTNGPSAVAVTPTNASCGASNGTITIGSVTGGTSPYTYSFDGSGYTSTLVYNNLGAGSHSVSVKDANGCTFSTTSSIGNTNGPSSVVVTPGNASCGASNGTITIGSVTESRRASCR